MNVTLVEPPSAAFAKMSQSGLMDGRKVIGSTPESFQEPPVGAPRRAKAAPKKAPVPPPAPPMPPVEEAPKPKKKAVAKKAEIAPAPVVEIAPAGKKKMEKGSEEAKAHMAKVRAGVKAKKDAIEAASKTPEMRSEEDVPKPKKKVGKKAAAVAPMPDDKFEA